MAEEERREDRPKRNWGVEIDTIRNSLDGLRSEIKKFRADLEEVRRVRIIPCAACKGRGLKLDVRGKPMQDSDFEPIYCPLCNGFGNKILS